MRCDLKKILYRNTVTQPTQFTSRHELRLTRFFFLGGGGEILKRLLLLWSDDQSALAPKFWQFRRFHRGIIIRASVRSLRTLYIRYRTRRREYSDCAMSPHAAVDTKSNDDVSTEQASILEEDTIAFSSFSRPDLGDYVDIALSIHLSVTIDSRKET